MGTTTQTWSVLEQQPAAARRASEDEVLRRQVAVLYERSPFYRDKLEAAGMKPGDIRSVDDLRDVPFTEKTELRDSLAAAPPLGRHLAADLDDVIQIQATSGTTGAPSYYGLTAHDCEVWNELGARAFFAAGLRPKDTVLHSWSMSKGFSGGVPVVKMLQHLGCRVIPIGAEAGTDRLLTVLRGQGADALCATPNLALHLGDSAAETVGVAASDLGVRHLVVGGEPGGGIPALRRQLESVWGAMSCEVLGNSDIATMVFAECPARDGMHFIGQDLVLVELIDPVSGDVLEPATGVTGEIVYTALDREASPLLRFRSRDHVEITGTECDCGRTSFKLRCFGRTDDMLIVRGVNVWPSAVQEIVAGFRPDATGNLRIVADFEGHTTQLPLKVKVEYRDGLATDEIDRLRDAITKRLRELLLFRAQLEMIPPGGLAAPGAAKVALVERP